MHRTGKFLPASSWSPKQLLAEYDVGVKLFKNFQFELAEDRAQQILSKVPDWPKAKELLELAGTEKEKLLTQKKEEEDAQIKKMLEEKLAMLKDFPEYLALRLKHMNLSHHGQFEFGSPKRPKFLEAFALNLIDDLDAKIKGISYVIEKDKQEGSWTEFNKLFERFLLKGKINGSEDKAGQDGDPEDPQKKLF